LVGICLSWRGSSGIVFLRSAQRLSYLPVTISKEKRVEVGERGRETCKRRRARRVVKLSWRISREGRFDGKEWEERSPIKRQKQNSCAMY